MERGIRLGNKAKAILCDSAVASPWVDVLGIYFTSPQLTPEQKKFSTVEGNTVQHGVGSFCFSSQMGLEVRVCLGKENPGDVGAAKSQSHACSEAVLLGGGCPGHWLLSAGAKANYGGKICTEHGFFSGKLRVQRKCKHSHSHMHAPSPLVKSVGIYKYTHLQNGAKLTPIPKEVNSCQKSRDNVYINFLQLYLRQL